MLSMTTSKTFKYYYKYDYDTSRQVYTELTARFPQDSLGGVFGICLHAWRGADAKGTGFAFLATNDTIPVGGYNLKYDATGTGTVAADSATVTDANYLQFTQVASIDSTTAQELNPRSITAYYNDLFQESLTNMQVYQLLRRIYGNYETFAINSAIDNVLLPRIGGNSQFSFRNSASNTELAFDCCSTWSQSDFTTAWLARFPVDLTLDPDLVSRIGSNYQRYYTSLIFSEEVEPEKLIFDVYVDGVIGEKNPNIQIRWRNNSDESQLSPELIKARIWAFGYYGASEDPSIYYYRDPELDINVPDDRVPASGHTLVPYSIDYAFTSQGPDYSYVGLANQAYDDWNTLERITVFGLDGIPARLGFFLRFDYEDDPWTCGDLYVVTVQYKYEGAVYVTATQITTSAYNPIYETEVNIIGGVPDDTVPDDPDEPEPGYDDDGDESADGPYPDPDDQPDISDYDSEGFPGDAVLTKTYKLSKARLQNIGTALWSQTYLDVLKIQANPIENIIACRWYPMDLTGGTEVGIKIGDVAMGVNGSPVDTVYTKTIGSYTYKGVISENGKNLSPGYLAQSPYTIIKLHLPYVGTVQLDASEIYDRLLTIQYVVDIVTGDILVLLKLGSHKLPYMSLSGKMGVDIPLSGSDRAQVQIAAAARAATALIGGAGHVLEGNAGAAVGSMSGILSMAGMDYSTQRVIQHSSVCASYDNRAVVLEMQVNKTHVSAGYKKYHGLPSHQYATLTRGMGFIQVSRRTIIDVAMTDEENRMLESIMTQGCYF